MREIKFRFWDIIKNKFVFIDEVNFKINNFYENIEFIFSKNIKLIQYTGLKDKNGKEIYEGDIVSYKWNLETNKLHHQNEILAVEWAIYGDGEYVDCIECYKIGYTPLSEAIYCMKNGSTSVEVIGNIYENKELLKGEN